MWTRGANKRYSQPHSCFSHFWIITIYRVQFVVFETAPPPFHYTDCREKKKKWNPLNLISSSCHTTGSMILKPSVTQIWTRATFCYSDEMFGFIDPLPNQSLLKDCHTNLETANKLCAKEQPFDFVDNATAAMETVPEQCHTNLETADKLCAKEEPFDFVDNATAAMETVPKQKDLPLRLYFGNGPRIHRQLCIEAGVVNKRCEDCGQVGQLTCFSSTFRKWALKRVTEEELNQICSRCHECGHHCLNCDIPITNRLVEVPVPKEKKTLHCGRGGKAGHT